MFAVVVWNREFEEWECRKGGISCRQEAQRIAEALGDLGWDAKVVNH